MTLPIRATPEDVRKIVGYLRTKPTGAAPKDMKAVLPKSVVTARKISAYQDWGFIEKEGQKYRLAKRGRELSRAGENDSAAFADLVENFAPYRAALEWVFHQDRASLDSVDVAARWHEHFSDRVASDDDTVLRQISAFFHITEAAGLGTYVQGRRGNPSRVDLDRSALGQFVAEASLEASSPHVAPEDEQLDTKDEVPPETAETMDRELVAGATTPGSTRVFISHGKNMSIVEQIKTMLELADLDYEVAVEGEETAIPVPEKVFAAMRRCTAAVISVTADEGNRQEDDSFRINENVLIEIGAAFVLYDKRVVLIWDKRIPVPSNLQGLYRSEFEGDELSWSAGMKLMKAVGKFRRAGVDGA